MSEVGQLKMIGSHEQLQRGKVSKHKELVQPNTILIQLDVIPLSDTGNTNLFLIHQTDANLPYPLSPLSKTPRSYNTETVLCICSLYTIIIQFSSLGVQC